MTTKQDLRDRVAILNGISRAQYAVGYRYGYCALDRIPETGTGILGTVATGKTRGQLAEIIDAMITALEDHERLA